MVISMSWSRLWRLFITNPLWQALAMGLLASLLAKGLWVAAPVTFAAFDWTFYDTWLRLRAPIATSELLVTVVRDPESEER